jgi:hypothetical protein
MRPKSRTTIDAIIDASKEDVRTALGDSYFTNGWELSFRYRGEDMNMRRPLRKDDVYQWYQIHVRAWETENGLELSVHEDLEPTAYPYYHLYPPSDVEIDDAESTETVLDILDNADISYQEIRNT